MYLMTVILLTRLLQDILELTNTKIINYLGNYDYYEEKCEELN